MIATYFREVTKHPLPTPEQERELFRAYRAAPDFNPDPKAPDGPVATKIMQQIAPGYLRFVIKFALGRTKDENLLLDLIAAGNMGLMVGIKRFDPAEGTRFLTYGAWWIRVHIQTAMREAGLGHAPLPPDLPTEDEEVRAATHGPVKYLADPAALPASDPDVESLLSSNAFNVLREMREAGLSRKEALILVYYYGLRGGPRQTFGQLSKLLLDLEGSYVSSERVRQIKEHALRNLRRAFKKKKLTSVTDVY